jgi:hypothetical protein
VTAKREDMFQGLSGEGESKSSGGSYVAGVINGSGFDGGHASSLPN